MKPADELRARARAGRQPPTPLEAEPVGIVGARNIERFQEWSRAWRGEGRPERVQFRIDRIVGWQFFGLIPRRLVVGFVYYFEGVELARWPAPTALRRRTFFPRQLPTKVHP